MNAIIKTAAAIISLAVVSTFAALDDGLVAYWKFDEGGGTTLKDHSGNCDNGTLKNNPKWVDGKFGKALEFSGNAYVQVPDNEGLRIKNDITFAAWLYVTGSFNNDVKRIARKAAGKGSDVTFFTSGSHPGCVGIYSGAWSGGETLFKKPLEKGKWIHVALTHTTSTGLGKCYWNGAPVSADNIKASNMKSAMRTSTGPLTIGNDLAKLSRAFPGIIDELRIYNRMLSDSEIAGIYNSGDVTAVNSQSPQKAMQPIEHGDLSMRRSVGHAQRRTAIVYDASGRRIERLSARSGFYIINIGGNLYAACAPAITH